MPKKKPFAKVTDHFEENYQNFLDMWSKNHLEQVKGIVKNAKSQTVSFLGNDVKKHSKVVSDLYYAQKALVKGASKDLPYQTLIALGEKLSHPAYKNMVASVIQDNMLKYKGEYLKLDDPYQQGKIRKAIRTYQFEVCSNLGNQDVA